MPENLKKARAVTLRTVTDTDSGCLFRIYASTREEEIAMLGLEKDQARLFLEQQYRARLSQYASSYPTDRHQAVIIGEKIVGYLYLYETSEKIVIVDIALLPDFRSQGIGSHLIEELQAEARQSGKIVELNVEMNNPAQHLYTRLGFTVTEVNVPYIGMNWEPS